MPRVLIAPTTSLGTEAVNVEQLLQEAGCCCDVSVWPLSQLAAKSPSDWDVLFVIVGCDLFTSAEEQEVETWVRAQVALVAVWCTSPTQAIPTVVRNYARALVRQDAKALAAVVCQEGTDWTGPGGESEPVRPIKRHKC